MQCICTFSWLFCHSDGGACILRSNSPSSRAVIIWTAIIVCARDSKLNRDVVIKVLLPSVANDPDRLARFSREAPVLASLNHPNIAHSKRLRL